jgi:hypothetical protein
MTDGIEAMTPQVDERELAERLVEQERADGVDLIGPGGLLTGLTKTVLETALICLSAVAMWTKCSGGLGSDVFRPAGVVAEGWTA